MARWKMAPVDLSRHILCPEHLSRCLPLECRESPLWFSHRFGSHLHRLTVLFGFFRAKQEHLTNDKVLGRSLQYIGRRTLDVYLIHYFLLPFREGGVVHFFTDHPMPIIEAFCSLMVALLIIAFSLLISSILRLSPILAHYLFGVKS